uniref:Uncharacterized protein n=1 Tax=Arundo donax TaxID=35708 RepID=A0A0A9HRM9_ARUDO
MIQALALVISEITGSRASGSMAIFPWGEFLTSPDL